jgi:hypothetical protein
MSENDSIRQLLARYAHTIDSGDADGWVNCFTAGGTFSCDGLPDGSPFNCHHSGTSALHSYASAMIGASRGRARHWLSPAEIELEGEVGRVTCYLVMLRVGGDGGPKLTASGVYRDRIRRVDGCWLFEQRVLTIDS